ncbi:MAG: hypothetical protein WB987_03985 [Candidatus Acidiferrales bacterium]
MSFFSSPRFLVVYSGALTVALAVIALAAFAQQRSRTKFGEIDVERINVIEPDGTLRMVISNKSAFPGAIVRGKEYPHPDRKTAGMLFFNDEATENGGLIFGGAKDANGRVESTGHLSFDQYEQDQVFTIDAGEEAGQRTSALAVWDRPDYPIGDLLATPPDRRSGFIAAHPKAHARVYLGRSGDRSVALRLKDVEGRDRIVIRVDPAGSPLIQLLDEEGKIIRQLPEPAVPKALR